MDVTPKLTDDRVQPAVRPGRRRRPTPSSSPSFEMRVGAEECVASICLPFGVDLPQAAGRPRAARAHRRPQRPARDGRVPQRRQPGWRARRSRSPCASSRSAMRPADLIGLRPGDVVPLAHPTTAPLAVTTADITFAHAVPGTQGTRLACLVVPSPPPQPRQPRRLAADDHAHHHRAQLGPRRGRRAGRAGPAARQPPLAVGAPTQRRRGRSPSTARRSRARFTGAAQGEVAIVVAPGPGRRARQRPHRRAGPQPRPCARPWRRRPAPFGPVVVDPGEVLEPGDRAGPLIAQGRASWCRCSPTSGIVQAVRRRSRCAVAGPTAPRPARRAARRAPRRRGRPASRPAARRRDGGHRRARPHPDERARAAVARPRARSIELDRAAGGPADLLVNGRLIARGEVVVIDENFGIRITEIVAPDGSGLGPRAMIELALRVLLLARWSSSACLGAGAAGPARRRRPRRRAARPCSPASSSAAGSSVAVVKVADRALVLGVTDAEVTTARRRRRASLFDAAGRRLRRRRSAGRGAAARLRGRGRGRPSPAPAGVRRVVSSAGARSRAPSGRPGCVRCRRRLLRRGAAAAPVLLAVRTAPAGAVFARRRAPPAPPGERRRRRRRCRPAAPDGDRQRRRRRRASPASRSPSSSLLTAAVGRAVAAADDDELHQDLRGAVDHPQRARPAATCRPTRCSPGWRCSSACSSWRRCSPR